MNWNFGGKHGPEGSTFVICIRANGRVERIPMTEVPSLTSPIWVRRIRGRDRFFVAQTAWNDEHYVAVFLEQGDGRSR